MSAYRFEEVTHIHHWNDKLFSFRTTRNPAFRFKNGQFTLIGLEVEGKPLKRAYSIASANYEEELEFFSIKVPNGPLTSRLQHIQPGNTVMVNEKATGTLINDNLLPGKHLYLISTGTGLAPFLSIIKDPDIYAAYDKVVLVHGVRQVADLAYADSIRKALPEIPYLHELARNKLLYFPTVTRESYVTQGRVTDHIYSGKLASDSGLPPFSPDTDRWMLCGSFEMIKDTCALLENLGFSESKRGYMGHFTTEKAFVQR